MIRGFLFVLISVSLIGCGSASHKAIRYSAPSTAPVREKISNVSTWVSNAQGHAAKAKEAVAKAKQLVGKDSVEPSNVPALRLSLDVADREIDALTAELVRAKIDLHQSDALIDDYEKQVGKLTKVANDAVIEKNDAISREAVTAKKYHGLKFILCALAAAAAGLLVFQLRGLFLLIPPPWSIIAMGAVPVAVFGFLWLRL